MRILLTYNLIAGTFYDVTIELIPSIAHLVLDDGVWGGTHGTYSAVHYDSRHDELQTASCDTAATHPLSTPGDKLNTYPLPTVVAAGTGDDILTFYRSISVYSHVQLCI